MSVTPDETMGPAKPGDRTIRVLVAACTGLLTMIGMGAVAAAALLARRGLTAESLLVINSAILLIALTAAGAAVAAGVAFARRFERLLTQADAIEQRVAVIAEQAV